MYEGWSPLVRAGERGKMVKEKEEEEEGGGGRVQEMKVSHSRDDGRRRCFQG
jgi:hypothetical protein